MSTPIVPRSEALSWDDYFMGVAMISALKSKDPHTQVGACIVNEDQKIVGIGYNGFPRGIDDTQLPFERSGDFLETKYPYICHAELNAILNSTQPNLKKCSIYVGLFPCNECAKAIIQSGIKEVIYLSDRYQEQDLYRASRKLLSMAGVHLRKLHPQTPAIVLSLLCEDPLER